MAEAQPSRVGRRLAAIVAADVAGYSRLMGLDEVGTALILREHRTVTPMLSWQNTAVASSRPQGTVCSLSFPRWSMRSNARWPCKR